MKLRLRTRIALSFALLSLAIAAAISAITYSFASSYLIGQRQNAALTRAILDARAAEAALMSGSTASEALDRIPSVGTSVQLLRVGESWLGPRSAFSPDMLPQDLLAAANPAGAQQRLLLDGTPWFVVAIPAEGGVYVEAFPLRDLDQTLRTGAWVLVGMSLLAALVGGIIGRAAFGSLLGPVRRLGAGAQSIAGGRLDTRVELTGDPDLDPIAASFNGMASAVQERIQRERRFSANVSHELRTPLTAILGTAELLESREAQLPDREREWIAVLGAQVRRMSQMLLDLLEISRLQSDDASEWEVTDVRTLTRELLVGRSLDPDLVLGDSPLLRTDARRLERIVGNLVDNAVRHGGGLSAVVLEEQGRDVVIHVDDAGPGVPEPDRERIFEPFARGGATDSRDGAGLGLAIAREQAASLGGDVTIDTSPYGGARFSARLPSTSEVLP